jgi:3-oxoadipate enol-lactonase
MPLTTGARAARIYYDVCGDQGAWVLLIHGLGLSSRFWFDLPQRLAALPYRVAVFDNRSVGRSDRPPPPYRIGDMADDACAVLDAAGIERAWVVGISLGGMIAQHLALRHPARVQGLALLATTPGLPHGQLPRIADLFSLLGRGFSKGGSGFEALGRLLLSERDQPRARELLAAWPEALAADQRSAGGFFGQLAAAAAHSVGSELGAIRCPTVIVAGSDDVLQPAANSRLLAKGIPHARLEVLDGVGHGIPLVDPDVVARSLATLEAASPAPRSLQPAPP